jgi:hypothetical protein
MIRINLLDEITRKRAYNRAWYYAHHEKSLASARRYVVENLEKTRKASALWARRNPDRASAWYKRHPEYGKRWSKENRDKKREYKHRRRARELALGGISWTANQWLELKAFYGNKCLCCGRKEDELSFLGLKLVPDHVLPVSRGGNNNISNIQPLCHGKGSCNNKKFTKSTDWRPNEFRPSASTGL